LKISDKKIKFSRYKARFEWGGGGGVGGEYTRSILVNNRSRGTKKQAMREKLFK